MSSGRFLTALALAIACSSATARVADAQQPSNTLPASIGDLNSAQLIEVRDQNGGVLLNGTLKTSSNKPKETERKAELSSPTGQEAKGKVEIEIERKDGGRTEDELEISVEQLPAMTNCQVLIDGQIAASFITSKNGKAKLKLERKPTTGLHLLSLQ